MSEAELKKNKVIERAVAIVGGQTVLARLCGTVQQNVWDWIHKRKKVPAEWVLPIERATKGAVTRYEIRPDLYPREENRDEA